MPISTNCNDKQQINTQTQRNNTSTIGGRRQQGECFGNGSRAAHKSVETNYVPWRARGVCPAAPRSHRRRAGPFIRATPNTPAIQQRRRYAIDQVPFGLLLETDEREADNVAAPNGTGGRKIEIAFRPFSTQKKKREMRPGCTATGRGILSHVFPTHTHTHTHTQTDTRARAHAHKKRV